MKNREILIQLIMKLRGVGIINNTLLNSIEKNPPHYYMKLIAENYEIKSSSYDELINIIKVFDYCLKKNSKINNFLIGNVKNGWSVLLASRLSKRVYVLCSNTKQKNKLEKVYSSHNFKNIFFTVGDCVSSWKRVAPFDIIFLLNKKNYKPESLISNLSDNGILFFPLFKDKSIKYVKIDKFYSMTETTINYDSINSSMIL